MSKNINKTKTKQKKTVKKAPYIGVFTLVFVGLVTVLASRYSDRLTLPTKESSAVVLPAAPSYTPILPIETQTPAPTPMPTEAPEPVAPVFNESKAFKPQPPLQGEILTPYSGQELVYSKTMSDWRTHSAIDILAPSGTNVCAVADGVIEGAYRDALMGETIVIAHEGGFKSIYQNLASTQMVTEGQTISAGQTIAVVGNTAPAELLEQTHLHFVITKDGTVVNPQDYLITPTE